MREILAVWKYFHLRIGGSASTQRTDERPALSASPTDLNARASWTVTPWLRPRGFALGGGLLTKGEDGRNFISIVRLWRSRSPPPPSVPGPWRRSPLGALRARESGTPTRSGVGSLGLGGPARQLRPSVI